MLLVFLPGVQGIFAEELSTEAMKQRQQKRSFHVYQSRARVTDLDAQYRAATPHEAGQERSDEIESALNSQRSALGFGSDFEHQVNMPNVFEPSSREVADERLREEDDDWLLPSDLLEEDEQLQMEAVQAEGGVEDVDLPKDWDRLSDDMQEEEMALGNEEPRFDENGRQILPESNRDPLDDEQAEEQVVDTFQPPNGDEALVEEIVPDTLVPTDRIGEETADNGFMDESENDPEWVRREDEPTILEERELAFSQTSSAISGIMDRWAPQSDSGSSDYGSPGLDATESLTGISDRMASLQSQPASTLVWEPVDAPPVGVGTDVLAPSTFADVANTGPNDNFLHNQTLGADFGGVSLPDRETSVFGQRFNGGFDQPDAPVASPESKFHRFEENDFRIRSRISDSF